MHLIFHVNSEFSPKVILNFQHGTHTQLPTHATTTYKNDRTHTQAKLTHKLKLNGNTTTTYKNDRTHTQAKLTHKLKLNGNTTNMLNETKILHKYENKNKTKQKLDHHPLPPPLNKISSVPTGNKQTVEVKGTPLVITAVVVVVAGERLGAVRSGPARTAAAE